MKDKPEIAAITVIVIGIGLIAGLVVNEQRRPDRPSSVLGTQFTQPPQAAQTDFGIPTLPVQIPPAVAPTPTATPAPAATTTAQATSSPRATSGTATRTSGIALYDISGTCTAETVKADGTKVPSQSTWARHRLAAGDAFRYTFSYDANRESKVTRSCTFRTTQVASGSESPLRILLACQGESKYSSTPPSPQTSAISKSWRPAQLTSGFTHQMSSPRQSQTAETTRCTLSVARA